MAGSLAIWVDSDKPRGKSKKLELHFNYWFFNHKKEQTRYLDIGIRFSDLVKKDCIKIFLPFILSRENYDSQLGVTVAQSPKLLSLIFNEEIKSTSYPVSPYCHYDIEFTRAEKSENSKKTEKVAAAKQEFASAEKSKNSKGIRFFTDISLAVTTPNALESNVTLFNLDNENGSLLTISLKNFQLSNTENFDGYFRFRLKLKKKDMDTISAIYKSKDRFMLTKDEDVELIDFRINDIRNLPDSVGKLIGSDPLFKKIHLFVIRNVESEYIMSGFPYSSVRLIEGNLWQSYLSLPANSKNSYKKWWKRVFSVSPNLERQMPKLLIFHFKKAETNDSFRNFSVFVKFRHNKTSWWIIGRNIVFLIACGLITNFLYDISGGFHKIFSIFHKIAVILT